MYSEQDLKYAAQLREEIHHEALAKVRAVCPAAKSVVDRYSVEDYFQKVWDYPGQWYTMVAIPEGAGGRKALIDRIVRDTLEHCRDHHVAFSDYGFYRLLAEYPDVVCEYCLVTPADQSESDEKIFPYNGVASHRAALGCAVRELFAEDWSYDLERATCKKLSGKALFAPVDSDAWLNYRRAFLCPPHANAYTDKDFDRVNAALFPGGAEGLEVYRWTTDWSDYFDDGHEWWGALCLTVYDRAVDRFVVIFASATD